MQDLLNNIKITNPMIFHKAMGKVHHNHWTRDRTKTPNKILQWVQDELKVLHNPKNLNGTENINNNFDNIVAMTDNIKTTSTKNMKVLVIMDKQQKFITQIQHGHHCSYRGGIRRCDRHSIHGGVHGQGNEIRNVSYYNRQGFRSDTQLKNILQPSVQ